MRTIPVGSMSTAAKRFDDGVTDCLSRLIGFKIDQNALVQLSLNVSNGGLGVRNVLIHHPAALFASIRASLELIKSISGLPGDCSSRFMLEAQVILVPSFANDLQVSLFLPGVLRPLGGSCSPPVLCLSSLG